MGPLEDQDAVRQARRADVPIEQRVLLRARLIARREHLDERVSRCRRGAGIAAFLLLALAVAAGAGYGMDGALGDGTRVVNVVWAAVANAGAACLNLPVLAVQLRGAHRSDPRRAGRRVFYQLTRKLARGARRGAAAAKP